MPELNYATSQKISIIRTTCLIGALLALASVSAEVLPALIYGNSMRSWPILISTCIAGSLSFTLYCSIKPTSNLAKVNLGINLLLGYLVIHQSIVTLTTTDPFNNRPLLFLTFPVLAGIIGVNLRQLIPFSGFLGLMLGVSFLIEQVGPLPHAKLSDLFSRLTILVVITAGVAVFTQRFNKLNHNLEAQTVRLRTLLVSMNSTVEFGESLSQRLTTLTGELGLTAQEQAGSSQEQVAALVEITVSLEELNSTASQIATSAASALQATDQGLVLASQVRDSGEVTQTTGIEGNEAVNLAVESVERASNRIELLGHRLLNLTEQTKRVSLIIDIIDEIAAETHLLSLNASIESAGSNSRFGIIAQEIKNLSDRSQESTKEVRAAISQMQGAVSAAVLVAEEGKKDTSAALVRSRIAGNVIDKLHAVIQGSAKRAHQILGAIEEINLRCDEISVATGQQRSANEQILMTMRSVSMASAQNAGTVGELSQAVVQVNQQIMELNAVLADSNRSVGQALAA